ncbi:MAG: DUF6036 family nucleotidyltransferase [Pseudomonadota bacterium]
MEKQIMIKALQALDKRLKEPVQILVGGGAAMLLAHGVSLTTMDIDGLLINTQVTPAELDALVKKVAQDLGINPQWFNTYFSTFTYTIPGDYKDRLKKIFSGKKLSVLAFGLEDLLIMKCFSGREKDIGHARVLVKKGADLELVENHIQKLLEKGLPNAQEALDFLDDIREQVGK